MPESGHGIFTLHFSSILLRREVRLKMLKETAQGQTGVCSYLILFYTAAS